MDKLLRGLVAMVVLSAGAAVASPCNDAHLATPAPVQPAAYYGNGNGDGFGLSVAPPPAMGHYVTREVRQWVPGYRTLQYSNHHHGQWVFIPGHYQVVAQRVWIGGPAYGVQVAPPPPARLS